MSIELIEQPKTTQHPIKILEQAAGTLDMEFERVADNELHLMLPSVWRDIGLWFTWRAELSTLQMGAPIDLKAPVGRCDETARLVTMVNERLWVGHFDLWTEDNAIVFRNASILNDSGLDLPQAVTMIRSVGEAVDRFYPAFNFLVWGGKKPDDAIAASLFETAGNA